MRSDTVKKIAQETGFELSGIAPAAPAADFTRLESWTAGGMAGEMRYLTDHRAGLRRDPRSLLPSARSIICVGKLYNTAPELRDPSISRYAWGSRDYHDVLRQGLEQMVDRLQAIEPFEWKVCVDTAPLLERTYARLAGLGWIGKNTCLIHEPLGSWFFLGEILTSLELEVDSPPPDRCGTCTRCIDACPTQALIPNGDGSTTLDSRRCISYLTIELRGSIPEELQPQIGHHVFGCDICQDVCPWNSRAPITTEPAFAPREQPTLEALANMTEQEFRGYARGTPLARPKYAGFQRNVQIAVANQRRQSLADVQQLSMAHTLAADLRARVDRELPLLSAITEAAASHKPAPNKWSNKEELGHLIDSAANNHVRFVSASIQSEYRGPGYAQDEWVARHAYQRMPWTEIVDFWRRYNLFIASVVEHIPEDRLQTPCIIGANPTVTLQFLIEDYTFHMQHHLDRILQREKITQYPGAAFAT